MKFVKHIQIIALALAFILTAGSFGDCAAHASAGTETRAVDLSGIGSSISDMFELDDENTWLFAGGVEAQGRYAEIQGNRSYIGHFEECVRRGGDGSGLQHHRYTISVGKAGQDLADFVAGLDGTDGYIASIDPRAIVYLIGEEDYDQGADGTGSFMTNMETMISSALALKDGTGFAVIQLPHAVNDATDMENIELYIDAAEEAISVFSEEQQKRIVLVDHYTSTNTDDFLNGGNLTDEGRLNADGHYVIARQLCTATIGDLTNFPSSRASWEEESLPETYLDERPAVTASTSYSLSVEMPESVAEWDEWIWSLEMGDMEISGEASGSSFVISDLPAKTDYKLTVTSADGSVCLASVYGTVSRGNIGGEQQLSELQQTIADKVNGSEPLTWLFTGDSITHGLVHTKGYDSVTQIFEKYVREDLGRTDDVVINTGVSSTDSTWLLENLETRVTKYQPDIVSIMIGTNDVYTNISNFHADSDGNAVVITADVYRQNLIDIVAGIREANPDCCIIFRSATPVKQGGRDTYLEDGYLQAMEEVAAEDGNIIYIDQYYDWNTELRTFTYLWGANYYYNDTNLHPGAAGQLRMMQQFIQATGLSTDTRLANLSYKFTYTESTSEVTPALTLGDDQVSVEKDVLQSDYTEAGESGTIGSIEITLTAQDGRTYTQSTAVDGDDFVMEGIRGGDYDVSVVATLADSAKHVTFAAQTITLEGVEPEPEPEEPEEPESESQATDTGGTTGTLETETGSSADEQTAYSQYAMTATETEAEAESGQQSAAAPGTKKLTAKQVKGKKQVKLTWKKVSGAKAYILYRSTKKNSGFVKIKTIRSGKKTSFVDRKVKSGKTYYYRIKVKTAAGTSAARASKRVKIR